MYRFFCQFPATGGITARDFEAIDRDPLVAMADVLKQVEQWRGNSQNPTRINRPDTPKPQPSIGGFGHSYPRESDFFIGFNR
jgi:hypothetical protein